MWLPQPSLLLQLFQKDPQVGYAFVSKRKVSGAAPQSLSPQSAAEFPDGNRAKRIKLPQSNGNLPSPEAVTVQAN